LPTEKEKNVKIKKWNCSYNATSDNGYQLFIFIMPASAHTPNWAFPSYPYVVPAPDPVGVEQTAAIVMWRY